MGKTPGIKNTDNKKMKILVVCQYYKPEPFRISDLCEEMVKRGHEVTVLTGVPNYPEGVIYDGYGKGRKKDEIINGVRVHRCFTIARRTGAVYRFLNYYSYAVSSSLNVLLNRCRPSDGGEYDVVFVNQLSPVMMAYAAMLYKKKHNKKLVLYCMDLWPESLVAGGIKRDSVVFRMFHKVSEKIYKSCNRILVTSRMFVDYIADQFGIDKRKITYLPQYAECLFDEVEAKSERKQTVDFMFAGNIGEMQSVSTIIKAAEIVENKTNGYAQRSFFHIVGSGTALETLKKTVSERGIHNVRFYGRKPVDDMPKYYSMADAMLVTLAADPVLCLTLPGKVQSYMAAGKAIIGAIDGEARIIIEDAECGYAGKADDADELAENILKFMSLNEEERRRFGENARAYYQANFERDKYMKKIEYWFRKNC